MFDYTSLVATVTRDRRLIQLFSVHQHGITLVIIIILYIYHALINALSAHMIHINLNRIFYTHVEHSPSQKIT